MWLGGIPGESGQETASQGWWGQTRRVLGLSCRKAVCFTGIVMEAPSCFAQKSIVTFPPFLCNSLQYFLVV